jgi:amino acid transporter
LGVLLIAAAPVSAPWSRLFGGPMIAVLFTFSGWFAAAYVGGEIVNPQRNLPRALILGSLAVTVIYLLINLVYVTALPLAELAGATNVAQVAVQALYGPVVARWVSLPIILAIAAGINAAVMTGSRVAYAMGRDGLLSHRLGHLHPVYRTPTVALACQALLAIILLLLGTFDQLLSYVVVVMVLSCLACGLALFVLRWRRPEEPRLYRAWGYPLVPLLFMGSYLLILVRITADRPGPALLGMLMTLSGLPIYLYQRRFKHLLDFRCVLQHQATIDDLPGVDFDREQYPDGDTKGTITTEGGQIFFRFFFKCGLVFLGGKDKLVAAMFGLNCRIPFHRLAGDMKSHRIVALQRNFTKRVGI